MKSVAVDQAAREVAAAAEAVGEAAGVELEPTGTQPFMVSRCTGEQGELSEEIYHVRGSYRLELGVDRADAWVREMQAKWSAAGWRTEVVTTAGGRPHLTAVDPSTGVEHVLGPLDPGSILFWGSSACYADPSGTPPFGPYSLPGDGVGTPGPSGS